MYSNEDLLKIKNKLRKTQSILILLCVISLSAIIVSFVYRQKFATIFLSIIFLSILYFIISVYLMPKIKYKKFLQAILTHINKNERIIEGTIKSISQDKVFYDGIECTTIVIKTGEDINGDIEALLYLDAEKALKDIKISDNLIFVLFDRFIIGTK